MYRLFTFNWKYPPFFQNPGTALLLLYILLTDGLALFFFYGFYIPVIIFFLYFLFCTALKDMGFINLPSTRTLYDYSHYVKSGCGFLPDVTKQLMKEVQDKKLTENWQTFVGKQTIFRLILCRGMA